VDEYQQIRSGDEDETRRQKGFDNLVIPDEHKIMLKAMVNDHLSAQDKKKSPSLRTTADIDLVRGGKGRGLIIFLYGPPGVGKTSTAETIAAYADPPRPLYPITCGDLGSQPAEIENNLRRHFKLAHRWGCVLLLDEAEVYLAERDDDINRNGVVSVFLRTLEYYSGILFLTSNREGLIDEAFKSRIHIALRYQRIDRAGTRQIWTNILRRLNEDNGNDKQKIKIQFDETALLKWAEAHFDAHDAGLRKTTWNGRQIRNAFQTAIAMASYDRLTAIGKAGLTEEEALKRPVFQKCKLAAKHFIKVDKVVQDFESYRKKMPSSFVFDPIFSMRESLLTSMVSCPVGFNSARGPWFRRTASGRVQCPPGRFRIRLHVTHARAIRYILAHARTAARRNPFAIPAPARSQSGRRPSWARRPLCATAATWHGRKCRVRWLAEDGTVYASVVGPEIHHWVFPTSATGTKRQLLGQGRGTDAPEWPEQRRQCDGRGIRGGGRRLCQRRLRRPGRGLRRGRRWRGG
jgi:hypothetical protein